jgi:chemotaxis protein histidine kinase CheA
MMEMSEPAPVEEVAPEAPQDVPEAPVVQDSPAPVEATPAPPEASPEVLPLVEAPATGVPLEGVSVPADGVMREFTLEPTSDDVTSAASKLSATVNVQGMEAYVNLIGELRLKVSALQDVESRLEQAIRENESLKEQNALHQAAANTDAAALLKQVAALVAPFA